MDNARHEPRFLHGDGQYRRKIAVRTRVGALRKDCSDDICTCKMTGDNAMFESRFLHGSARHRRKIVARTHFGAFARAIFVPQQYLSRWPSRLPKPDLARAYLRRNISVADNSSTSYFCTGWTGYRPHIYVFLFKKTYMCVYMKYNYISYNYISIIKPPHPYASHTSETSPLGLVSLMRSLLRPSQVSRQSVSDLR